MTTSGGQNIVRVPPARVARPIRDPGVLARLWHAVDRRFFFLAVLPGFAVVALITVIPFLSGFGLSFSSVSSVSNNIFPLTLSNYRQIFHDSEVGQVLTNTVLYVGMTVVVELVGGLVIALLLAQRIRGITLFRVVFMLPLMVAGVASAISWSALFNTSQGWINYYLHLVGLPQPNWLASPSFAMPSVVIADMWSGVPVVSIIILAALISMPQEPVEAASVDGASAAQRLRYVVLPAIWPVLTFAALLRTVAEFQQFGLFQIMTGGGPGLSTSVLNYYVYQVGFVYNNIGYSAALAVLLVVMMIVPLAALFALSQRR